MKTALVVAGLVREAHERLSRESVARFVPNGQLIARPIGFAGSYPKEQAAIYLRRIHTYIASLPEGEKVSIVLAYVDYDHVTTKAFVESFFPFALPRPLRAINFADVTNPNTKRKRLNEYISYLTSEARSLTATARVVGQETDIANLTPLLLPLRNFQGDALGGMVRRLFDGLSADPAAASAMLNSEIREFKRSHPLAYPGSRGGRHCFSDGVLHFKSPGRNRHGYYRLRTKEVHNPACLLNARSRLGGVYDHAFHFDCTAVRGRLAAEYPNCHGDNRPPNTNHVNIAPNDFIS